MKLLKNKLSALPEEIKVIYSESDEMPGYIGRRICLVFLLIIMIAFSVIASFINKFYIDTTLAFIVMEIFFFIVFYIQMEVIRLKRGKFDLAARDYRSIFVVIAIGLSFCLVTPVIPALIRPFLVISLLLAVIEDFSFGITVSSYMAINAYIINSDSSAAFLVASLMIIFAGSCFVWTLRDIAIRGIGTVFVFASAFVPSIFSLFVFDEQINFLQVIYAVINAAICAIISFIFVPFMERRIEDTRNIMLNKMVMPNFPLAVLMQKSSSGDYDHAKRVSDICEVCAMMVGADAPVCKAAGLYYRIGKMDGEPHVENGVKIAGQFNFPEEVMQILREYNAEQEIPSSVESAIVHIVDCVTTKFDVLQGQATTGGWNREMIIYQTLNEKSSMGIYDASGLGMNQFLKIRDYLVRLGGK